MTAAPEVQTGPGLGLPGLTDPEIRLYPLVDHIADKLCAIQATYGARGDQPSSRVKDLVDLVVFARTQDVDGPALTNAIHREWSYRNLPASPRFLPPSSWSSLYPALARKVPACVGLIRLSEAETFVRRFLSPSLELTAHDRVWSAGRGEWLPATPA